MKNFFNSKSKTKRSWLFKNSLKFNPVVAVIIMLVIGGIGAWTLRESFADNSGIVRVRAYSVENGSQIALSGVSGMVYSVHPCSGNPINLQVSTAANGIYTYQYDTNCAGGNAIFCLPTEAFSKAGYTVTSAAVDAGNSNTGSTGICGSITGTINPLLSFTVLLAPNATLNFSAGSNSIVNGNSTTLSWSSANATSCNSTAGGINISGAKSGSITVKPTQTTTYTIVCTGSTGPSVTRSVAVTVTNPPPTSSSTKKPTTTKTPSPVKPTVNATTGDTSPPTKPAGLTAIFKKGGTVDLSWSGATDNVGVKSYLIERSIDATVWTTISTNTTGLSYTDNNPPEDAAYYYYRLRAQDNTGNQSEAAFTDVENAVLAHADDTEPSNKVAPQSNEAAVKKKSTVPTGLKVGGVILLLALVVGGIILYRRRRADQFTDAPYDTPAPYVPSSTTTPPSTINPGQTAPHTSKSLKDMVLEDYNTNQGTKPPSQHDQQ